jgi:toxin-antitoxin system PIN domain toxin
MLIDANILLFAVDEASVFHQRARDWLVGRLNGDRRVGLPWESLAAFLRIATHPRATDHPIEPEAAIRHLRAWLAADVAWTPTPTDRHAAALSELVVRYQLRGNLVPDAHLAALAIEHGLTVCSADTDFARFQEVRWVNPLAI